MTDREKFLFDLQGFLVVRDFLSSEEVDVLNAAVDANQDKIKDDGNSHPAGNLVGEFKRGMFSGMLAWDKPWCLPFRELLAHPKIVPYLNEMMGRGWKMDHSPFILTSKVGTEGLRLHGSTARLFDGAQYYTYNNGRMRCGMVVFQYQLADVNPGDGGLCVIPGGHKANYACPEEIKLWHEDQDLVHQVVSKKGDLVIFNEATIHGTLPWKGKGERRSLLYRYSPKYLHFSGGTYRTEQPEWVSELTEAQQAVLEPPYIYNRPLIEEDGVSVVSPRRDPI